MKKAAARILCGILGIVAAAGISIVGTPKEVQAADKVIVKKSQLSSESWTALSEYDKNSDGKLTKSEAAAVTVLNTEGDGADLVKYMKYFKNLESFVNYSNEYPYDTHTGGKGKIKKIDFSKNKKLVELGLKNCKLKSLDLSKNKKLKSLYVYSNELKTLDLRKNKKLQYCYCYDNKIKSLKLGKNTNLYGLYADLNKLTKLDLGGVANLNRLSCTGNSIKKLNLKKNKDLFDIYCDKKCKVTGVSKKFEVNRV